jgi:hypothetical protein
MQNFPNTVAEGFRRMSNIFPRWGRIKSDLKLCFNRNELLVILAELLIVLPEFLNGLRQILAR